METVALSRPLRFEILTLPRFKRDHLLLHVLATIDGDICAGYERGLIVREVGNEACDLLRLAESAHGNLRNERGARGAAAAPRYLSQSVSRRRDASSRNPAAMR